MRELRLILAGLVLALGASAVLADERRVVGLLELPGIFGTRDADGPPALTPPAKIRPVSLHARPGAGSPVVGKISGPDAVEAEEFDYEARAALAYQRAEGWTLVRANGMLGWVAPQSAGRFHPFAQLIESGLCFLTAAWDGVLYAGAGSATVAGSLKSGRRREVNIVRRIGSWLELEVLEAGRCEGRKVRVLARGWVPMHREDGKRNVWFHSRGC